MSVGDVLVSVGLPVRNAENRVQKAIESVLSQDHENLELVISDNASTDGTQDICRQLARADHRIVYRRNPENIGLLNNFVAAMRLASGEYFRWIGHDDALAPDCLSRSAAVLFGDHRLLLVTSQIEYELDDGSTETARYCRRELGSDDPADRFVEWMRLLTQSYALLDPLYALMRRDRVVPIQRQNVLREDQIFAAKLALAGPWAHVPDVLLMRRWSNERAADVTMKIGVPRWTALFARELECRQLLQIVGRSRLDRAQRTRACGGIVRMYVTQQRLRAASVLRRAVGNRPAPHFV